MIHYMSEEELLDGFDQPEQLPGAVPADSGDEPDNSKPTALSY